MKKGTFKSYEDLPLMLSVPEMGAALGISRAGAYELARSEGFPALRIGTRIVIPKDQFIEWVNRKVADKHDE
mgnify:CR=1 FL=1